MRSPYELTANPCALCARPLRLFEIDGGRICIPCISKMAMEAPSTCTRDEDCLVEQGICIRCGVEHGEGCEVCGGRAYHRFGCLASDETVAALAGIEVRFQWNLDPAAEGKIVESEGRLLILADPMGEQVIIDAEGVEPAEPEGWPQAGEMVLFQPWLGEPAGESPVRAARVNGRQGIVLDLIDLSTGIHIERLDVGVIRLAQVGARVAA